MPCRPRVVLLVLATVVLAGCGTGPSFSATETPLTPVAVPTDSPTAESGDPAVVTPTPTPNSTVTEPRYLSLRPTCERPPGLVVAIQVGALMNDSPGSHEGINTTWQFAAPSNRRAIGSFGRFVDVIERGYEPLLDAETVTYGPLTRGNGTASLRVTVESGNRTTTYRWALQRQAGGPREGCWLTIGVREVESNREGRLPSTPPAGGLPRL
ncbi:MAG: DUF4864 domain-containing protein [Haloarculaceae archaeon]